MFSESGFIQAGCKKVVMLCQAMLPFLPNCRDHVVHGGHLCGGWSLGFARMSYAKILAEHLEKFICEEGFYAACTKCTIM